MHQGKHGHCHSATIDWVLITACAPRPDLGHGAYAGAYRRVVFQKANCEPCFGSQFGPVCVPFECSVIVSASVGKQKARKSLFKSCQAPGRVEPSEDAFSTGAWCPNGHGFCL